MLAASAGLKKAVLESKNPLPQAMGFFDKGFRGYANAAFAWPYRFKLIYSGFQFESG